MLPNLSLRGGRRPTWQSRRTMVDNRWASAKTKPLAGDSHVASLLGMTHQGSAVMHQCPCAVESSRAWRSLSAATDAIGVYIFSAAYTSPRLPQPLWGLAMTNLEALRGRRCHPITCQPARRAGNAATDAIGLCVFAGSLYELQVPAVFRLRILPPVRQRMRNR